MPILKCRSLSKHFGGLKAVDRVDFQVEQGQVYGIIGPNGAGKTTIFNLLTGFIKPTDGEAVFMDTNILGLGPHHIAKLGLTRTYQHTAVFPSLTVLENAQIGFHRNQKSSAIDALLRTKRWAGDERESIKKAQDVLAQLGLSEEAWSLAENLAYGQQRLVELAIALSLEPTLLLLDEPASGMNQDEMTHIVRQIGAIRDHGVTVLLVEHNMKVVMGISDHILVLDHGCVIASGTPAEVSNDPKVIEAYLGGGFVDAQN